MSISSEHKTQNTFRSCQSNRGLRRRARRGRGEQTSVFEIAAAPAREGCTWYGKLAWDLDTITPSVGASQLPEAANSCFAPMSRCSRGCPSSLRGQAGRPGSSVSTASLAWHHGQPAREPARPPNWDQHCQASEITEDGRSLSGHLRKRKEGGKKGNAQRSHCPHAHTTITEKQTRSHHKVMKVLIATEIHSGVRRAGGLVIFALRRNV